MASGGDGFVEQFCTSNFYPNIRAIILTRRAGFVGFDPTLNSVIVGHQGTKLENM